MKVYCRLSDRSDVIVFELEKSEDGVDTLVCQAHRKTALHEGSLGINDAKAMIDHLFNHRLKDEKVDQKAIEILDAKIADHSPMAEFDAHFGR